MSWLRLFPGSKLNHSSLGTDILSEFNKLSTFRSNSHTYLSSFSWHMKTHEQRFMWIPLSTEYQFRYIFHVVGHLRFSRALSYQCVQHADDQVRTQISALLFWAHLQSISEEQTKRDKEAFFSHTNFATNSMVFMWRTLRKGDVVSRSKGHWKHHKTIPVISIYTSRMFSHEYLDVLCCVVVFQWICLETERSIYPNPVVEVTLAWNSRRSWNICWAPSWADRLSVMYFWHTPTPHPSASSWMTCSPCFIRTGLKVLKHVLSTIHFVSLVHLQ